MSNECGQADNMFSTPLAIAVCRYFEGLSMRKIKNRLDSINKSRSLSTIKESHW